MKMYTHKLSVVMVVALLSVTGLSMAYAQTMSTGSMSGMNMSTSGHHHGGNGTTGSFTHKSSGSSSSHLGTTHAVPEFGSVASVVLAISVVSLVIMSAKTRLRFLQF